MTKKIINEEPKPEPQTGNPVRFARRKPKESRLPEGETLEKIYDFIRMLDAEGYPAAFVEYGNFRIEFSRPALRRGRVEADVSIRIRGETSDD